jgi:hypothetical protein
LAIEYRWAQSQVDRLRSLTADLVSRRVAVIAAMDTPSALATKEVIAPTSMLRIPPSMYLSPSAYTNTGCSHPGGSSRHTDTAEPLSAIGVIRPMEDKSGPQIPLRNGTRGTILQSGGGGPLELPL